MKSILEFILYEWNPSNDLNKIIKNNFSPRYIFLGAVKSYVRYSSVGAPIGAGLAKLLDLDVLDTSMTSALITANLDFSQYLVRLLIYSIRKIK